MQLSLWFGRLSETVVFTNEYGEIHVTHTCVIQRAQCL